MHTHTHTHTHAHAHTHTRTYTHSGIKNYINLWFCLPHVFTFSLQSVIHHDYIKPSLSWIVVKGQAGLGCSHMQEAELGAVVAGEQAGLGCSHMGEVELGAAVAGGQACTPLVQGCTRTVLPYL